MTPNRKGLIHIAVAMVLVAPLSVAHAFIPGKWNPMDAYVKGATKGGPRALIVTDPKGKVRQSAEFQYDATGRLIKEVYIDSAGKKDGSTAYEYRGGKVSTEKLFNKQGKVVENKTYLYSAGKLSGIQVTNDKNQEIMSIDYKRKGGMIHIAEEKRDRTLDRIVFEYKKDRLDHIIVKDDSGNVLSKTKYEYDRDGRLVKRERFQGGRRFACKYIYQPNGRVAGYEYLNFNPERNQWQLVKRLKFKY